ncbi:MAG: HD domain-containing protein [Peptococcaceae bacterium]|nr:HD domain-containing protein [Peptococcaceae bacterium]
MRRIPVNRLRVGMKVGRPIYNSRGELLLQAGTFLTSRVMAKLQRLGIPAVYINDGLVPDIEVKDVIAEETRVKAIKKVRTLMQEWRYGDITNKPQRMASMSAEMKATVKEIIEQLLNSESTVVNLVDIRTLDEYTFGHSVNVCVLSLCTGIVLKYDRARLFHLGMGALLHDLGKTKINLEILNKKEPLTSEEMEIIKQHPLDSYKMLSDMSDVSNLSAITAYQHHERHQGQGYPQGLAGDDIHVFAKIVSVADVFDALTADRVYRSAYPAHQAYELLCGAGNFLFDYDVVEAFLSTVAAYPVGTVVALSSGEIGVILETYKGYPLRPHVRILFDRQGWPVKHPYEINLAEKYDIAITRVLEEEEITMLARQQRV